MIDTSRRGVIKSLMLSSGVLALPSWAYAWNAIELSRFSTVFSEHQLNILTSICDVIIPSSGEVGAVIVGVDKFIARLINDCYESDFLEEVILYFNDLDKSAHAEYQKGYSDCDATQRLSLFMRMAASPDENAMAFFNFMKAQTIRGFETSEQVLVNHHGYVMMPGFYDGDVDVKASNGGQG